MIDLVPDLLSPEEQVAPPLAPAPSSPKSDPGHAPKPPTQASNESKQRRSETPSARIELDPPYGERGDFEKITITLPSEVRALLLDESNLRKKRRSSDWPIAAIVRQALAAYLTKKGA